MLTIDDLLAKYENTKEPLRISSQEKEYLKRVLRSIADFASVIGMEECFEQHFDKVLFFVKNSTVILDCLNPQSRYCPDMQKAIKLFVLIVSLQNKCLTSNAIDSRKLEDLLRIKNIETYIKDNLSRERDLKTSLLFFAQMLNDLVFDHNSETINAQAQYIIFKTEDFDTGEILVAESALMAVLGAFQLARELKENDVKIDGSLKYFFKLYYIYYAVSCIGVVLKSNVRNRRGLFLALLLFPSASLLDG